MWPVKLVGRAHQEVAIPSLDVDQCVWCIVNRVDIAQRAGVVSEASDLCDIVDSAERIRRGADRDEAGARRDRAFHLGKVELTSRGIKRHDANRDATLALDRTPWRDVALMIEVGDDDLVLCFPSSPERA